MARRKIAAKAELAKYSRDAYGPASIELRATVNPVHGSRVYWRDQSGFMQVPKEAKEALYKLAEDTAKIMKREAPVGKPTQNKVPSSHNTPGRLRNSIGAFKTESGGIVAVTADHWNLVEGGTTDHPITGPNGISFWGTFRYNGKNVTRKSGKNAGQRKGKITVPSVHHPGTKARPFIYRNFKEAKYEALDYVVDAVRYAKTGGFNEGKKYL